MPGRCDAIGLVKRVSGLHKKHGDNVDVRAASTMKDAMNLHEVARRAKVSTATVSRVLNNARLVKSSTRARVVKAIEELKYHPNLHARSLAGGKSSTIGVIVSNLENPFFFDIY